MSLKSGLNELTTKKPDTNPTLAKAKRAKAASEAFLSGPPIEWLKGTKISYAPGLAEIPQPGKVHCHIMVKEASGETLTEKATKIRASLLHTFGKYVEEEDVKILGSERRPDIYLRNITKGRILASGKIKLTPLGELIKEKFDEQTAHRYDIKPKFIKRDPTPSR